MQTHTTQYTHRQLGNTIGNGRGCSQEGTLCVKDQGKWEFASTDWRNTEMWALSREAGNLESYVNISHMLLVGPHGIKTHFVCEITHLAPSHFMTASP